MNDDSLSGKKAEKKIKEWLDRPEDGYSFYRIPDQLSGLYGSKNPCDFHLYKYPYEYWIESKATFKDNFAFSKITEYQYDSLLEKSKIRGAYGLVIVLFATYKRAFVLAIQDIDKLIHEKNKKSINITKIDKWEIDYKEIKTIPSRKELLDYCGEIEEYVQEQVI